MDWNKLSTVCVLGAGVEGISAAAFLKEKYPQLKVTLADTKLVTTRLDVIVRCGDDYPTDLGEWECVVVSPGIHPSTPLLATAHHITTATNIFLAHCKGTVVGVTGSKGKSTTSSLIAHILKTGGLSTCLVGNIGNPALDRLRERNYPEDVYVYELSSYQASRLEKGPDIAVIVNLFPEHLNYHGSLEEYYSDKLKITTTQTAEHIVIYNAENITLAERIAQSPAQKIAYPDRAGFYATETHLCHGAQKICAITELQLKGAHNVSNCIAALTTAAIFNVAESNLREALISFAPLPHRLQYIGVHAGIEWIDDAISTTPESTLAALAVFQNTGAIILGGLDRGYDFTELAKVIAERKIPVIVYFPDSGKTIEQAIANAGYGAPHTLHTASMHDAVAFIAQHAEHGSTALLSCAAPSYTIFKNFEDKGDQFQTEIHLLKE